MEEMTTDFYFQWHITNICNNRCKHCYHADYDAQNECNMEQLMAIADDIDDALEKWNYNASLSITGGEPFARKNDLFKVLDRLEESQRIVNYDILTNGSLIKEPEIAILKKHSKLRRIQVSMEGATAQSHDNIRGEGDFDRVVNAIKLLKKHGFTLSVMTTLTRNNRNEITDLINLLTSLDVDYFALERFMPEGQSESNKEWALSKEETKETFEYVTELAFKTKKPNILLYRALYTLCKEDDTVGAMCSAGVSALTIMPDATIYPCRRLPIDIGNVLKEGIVHTWYTSPLLCDLRDYRNYKGKCNNCEHILKCRGCRSMAYIATGDYMQEDPQCWK